MPGVGTIPSYNWNDPLARLGIGLVLGHMKHKYSMEEAKEINKFDLEKSKIGAQQKQREAITAGRIEGKLRPAASGAARSTIMGPDKGLWEPQRPGFTLSQGQQRFGAEGGQPIASVAEKTPAVTTAMGAFLNKNPDATTEQVAAYHKNLKQSDPSTGISWYLQRNPGATEDEVAAFSQKLKGGKYKTTIGPDGTVTVEMGGAAGMSPSATSKVEKDVVGLMTQVTNLEALGKETFKDALTMQGQVKGKALKLADWMKIDIGPKNKEFLGKSRQFIEGIEQVFNSYRKEITGAQAAMKEIAMLRDSILNRKMTPTQFEYSYDRYMGEIKRTLRLKRMLLRQGLSGKQLNQSIDRMFTSKGEVPKAEIDARGDELMAMFISQKIPQAQAIQQSIAQLRSEGYMKSE